MPHLLVDISSHGFGHLAQTAPILNALRKRLPDLRLTIRSGLPREKLDERLRGGFAQVRNASDFGFVMFDPLRVDLAATARRYREVHANWSHLVADEAAWLSRIGADFVLSNVAYLPLAGASSAGIPAAACCSLNWHALFEHFFVHRGAPGELSEIASQILAAYESAPFLALEPAMAMPRLTTRIAMPPVAEGGRDCRAEILRRFPEWRGRKLVLVGFGGIPMGVARYPLASWAAMSAREGLRCAWLVPDGAGGFPDSVEVAQLEMPHCDLQASCDAIIGKPGYGTFVEAAVAGTPVLWIRREDWPEQDCLISWLATNGGARELTPAELAEGRISEGLAELWARRYLPVPALGADRVAAWLAARLGCSGRTRLGASQV